MHVLRVCQAERPYCEKILETTDLQIARRKLRDFLRELDSVDPGTGNVSFISYAQEYFDTLRQAPSTMAEKSTILRRIRDQWQGGSKVPIKQVKSSDIVKWLARYDFGDSSHNSHLWFVREVLRNAVNDRLIPFNPANDITARSREKKIRITPTYEQFRAVVEDLRQQKLNGHNRNETADYVEFMGGAGLGQAEIKGILAQHVDLASNRIMVFRMKTVERFTVPIYPNVRPIVEPRMAKMERPDQRLFPFDNCRKALEGACTRLKFPKFTPRSLRRMFITRALRRGIDVKTIAAWQGHQDGGKLILDTYSDVVKEPHSQSMAQLLAEEPANVIPMEKASG